MDEHAAKAWLHEQLGASAETLARLEHYVDFLRTENRRQNLVSAFTLDDVWSRHIVDSAQVVQHAPDAETWLDIGTGAGFPGLIIAALHPAAVTMVESRSLRVDFLKRAAGILQLPNRTTIICDRVERLAPRTHDVISARACAPLHRLLDLGIRFAAPETRWVLPKGRNATAELAAVQGSWQGMFHVERSLTDPESGIIVATHVRRVQGRG